MARIVNERGNIARKVRLLGCMFSAAHNPLNRRGPVLPSNLVYRSLWVVVFDQSGLIPHLNQALKRSARSNPATSLPCQLVPG
jgi:hypothetical protein